MYMYDLTKVNEGFEKMKNVRSKIEGGFTTIHAKLKMLRKIYSEVVSKHKNFTDVPLDVMEGYWQDAKAYDRKQTSD